MSSTYFDRSVILSGVLSPPVIVNGSYPIKTQDYSVQMNQKISLDSSYMQGGPGKAVASISKKIIDGNISFPLRINESNVLQSGIIDILNSGQNYNSLVTLTTFLLPYNAALTAESDPYVYSTNSLVFDTCVVEKTTITAKKNGPVNVSISIKGQTDVANLNPLTIPADDTNLYRNVDWYDCFFERNGSQLENLIEFSFTIEKEVDQKFFLMYCAQADRYDRPFSTGVKSVGVSFKIVEHITSAFDIFGYSLGGFFNEFNLTGTIGPISFMIPDSLLKISVQNLTPDIIERTTEGFYRMSPSTPLNENFLFTIT